MTFFIIAHIYFTGRELSMASATAAQFFNGLKSKNEKTRAKAATDLFHYVTTELREVSSVDDLSSFLDACNHNVFEMVSSENMHEKKGGILAIGNSNFLLKCHISQIT